MSQCPAVENSTLCEAIAASRPLGTDLNLADVCQAFYTSLAVQVCPYGALTDSGRYSLLVVVLLLTGAGGLGSLLVIVLFLADRALWRGTHALLFNLALADLLLLLVMGSHKTFVLLHGRLSDALLCRAWAYGSGGLTVVSALSAVLVGLDRYVRVCCPPAAYSRLSSPTSLGLALTLVWLAGALCLYGIRVTYARQLPGCAPDVRDWDTRARLYGVSGVYFLTLALVVVLYGLLTRKVTSFQRSQLRRSSRFPSILGELQRHRSHSGSPLGSPPKGSVSSHPDSSLVSGVSGDGEGGGDVVGRQTPDDYLSSLRTTAAADVTVDDDASESSSDDSDVTETSTSSSPLDDEKEEEEEEEEEEADEEDEDEGEEKDDDDDDDDDDEDAILPLPSALFRGARSPVRSRSSKLPFADSSHNALPSHPAPTEGSSSSHSSGVPLTRFPSASATSIASVANLDDMRVVVSSSRLASSPSSTSMSTSMADAREKQPSHVTANVASPRAPGTDLTSSHHRLSAVTLLSGGAGGKSKSFPQWGGVRGESLAILPGGSRAVGLGTGRGVRSASLGRQPLGRFQFPRGSAASFVGFPAPAPGPGQRMRAVVAGFYACVALLALYSVPVVCFLTCAAQEEGRVRGDRREDCSCQVWAHPVLLVCSALNSLAYGATNRHFRQSARKQIARLCHPSDSGTFHPALVKRLSLTHSDV